MDKIKIVAVSYLNTKPFIHGLTQQISEDEFELQLLPPALCSQSVLKEEADIALVPAATLPNVPSYKIITDYCIGSERKVDSVCLYSHVPLEQIEEILLDFESQTSVQLVRILAFEFWRIQPKYTETNSGFINDIKGNTAAVVIGDKTFELSNQFNYVYDLAEEWYKFTSLPFVFACWIAKKSIKQEFINKINTALKHGLDHIETTILDQQERYGKVVNIREYFKNSISFNFSEQKLQGLNLFLEKMLKTQEHKYNILP